MGNKASKSLGADKPYLPEVDNRVDEGVAREGRADREGRLRGVGREVAARPVRCSTNQNGLPRSQVNRLGQNSGQAEKNAHVPGTSSDSAGSHAGGKATKETRSER